MSNKSEMIIYQTEDGLTKVNVTFDADTVWLSLDQMAELFQRDKSVVSRHIRNIFSEVESITRSPEKQLRKLFITGQTPKRNSWAS